MKQKIFRSLLINFSTLYRKEKGRNWNEGTYLQKTDILYSYKRIEWKETSEEVREIETEMVGSAAETRWISSSQYLFLFHTHECEDESISTLNRNIAVSSFYTFPAHLRRIIVL